MLRLLAGHPTFEVVAASAARRAGQAMEAVLPHLRGTPGAFVSTAEALSTRADVCFSCLPSGSEVARSADSPLVIDLADTHRADPAWTYGLPEMNRSAIRDAGRVANPGCYPTAVQLALVPFVRAGVVGDEAIVDAVSGVSGAGRRDEDRLLFSNLAGDMTAYGSGVHRHVPEMETGLARYGGADVKVSFTPHLAPIARGLLATCRMRLTTALDDDGALSVMADAYADERFITVSPAWPAPKAVTGTNRVHLSARVDNRTGWLIASAALDNLGKGAAGQAIQNANLAAGLPETMGLGAVGVWP